MGGGSFYEWYKDHKLRRDAGEQVPQFEDFLNKIETQEIKLPFDLASFDVRIQRENLKDQE
jgi:hypothetical protein